MPTLTSFDPATGEAVGSVEAAAPADIGHVVARARAAQPAWAALGLEARAACLKAAVADLRAAAPRIGELITREMGKPLPEGKGEAMHAAESLAAEVDGIVEALRPQVLEDAKTVTTLHRDPFGTCAAITPWNFPVLMPQQSVLPALVAGNAVVLKPSEETPLCAQAWADCLAAHLPPDVLRVAHGAGDVGRALVRADVDLIVFTGSRETGISIMKDAAEGLKRVILELGGKDPLVVLDDADLDAAAAFAVRNSFRNAGQVCVSTERIYVAAGVRDEFLGKMRERTLALRQGDPRGEGVSVGPMVHARQKEKVLAQIDDALARGATLVAGGEPREGNFVAPTILADCTHEMEIMREETFGPVACVQAFETVDQAVRLANDTPFGLGAAVFGRDLIRAGEVAARIEAGMVGINRGCGGVDGCPWVGAKESGYGFHSGPEGHRQFAQVRVITRPK